MSVLSNRALVEALDEGRLVIEPRPNPAPGEEGTPFNTMSVDLRLSSEISVPKKGLNLTFDLLGANMPQTLSSVYETEQIPENGWVLAPNDFVLSNTLELVELPLVAGRSLAARIEGRSSFARTGLLVHFTAPTIHAGFRGRITLELINLGAMPLILRPGQNICQLIVETVEGDPFRADSQFHNQQSPPGR